MTERKKQEEIKYLSFHDSLTGLYNRRYFDIEFDRLNTPRNHPISIITADINGLKITNDVFGHSVGDHLIQKAAKYSNQDVGKMILLYVKVEMSS